MTKEILRALSSVPTPPCCGCAHASECARLSLGCDAWETYAEHGTVDLPARGRHVRRIHLSESGE